MPKLQHIPPILFTWLSLWLALGPLIAPFYFHFCWQLWAHPWTVIICCSASLCSVSGAEACSCMLTQKLNFPSLLFPYFFHNPSFYHPLIHTLFLYTSFLSSEDFCVGVDLMDPSHWVETHEKETTPLQLWPTMSVIKKHKVIKDCRMTSRSVSHLTKSL